MYVNVWCFASVVDLEADCATSPRDSIPSLYRVMTICSSAHLSTMHTTGASSQRLQFYTYVVGEFVIWKSFPGT